MAVNFNLLRQLRLGGPRDTWALTSLGASAVMSSPYFTDFSPFAVFGLAAASGAYLGDRYFKFLRDRPMMDSVLRLQSDVPPLRLDSVDGFSDGLLVGYCSDNGSPVVIPDEDLVRHMFIVGQSGVGKTVLGRLMMLQQIQRGGGLLFIDGKLNHNEILTLYRYCVWAGREHDFYVINPGNPAMSHQYNPILEGDPDEVSSRILSLIPSTDNNPGADHYKQAANQGLTTLVGALKHAGLAYNFMDLCILLMSQKAIMDLERLCPDGPQKTNLTIFLDQYRINDKDGKSVVDVKRLKETFGGIGGRMYSFGTGSFGEVMNTYTPDISMFDAVTKNKIVYVALPTMGKQVAAENLGKMIVGDFRSAISRVQALPDSQKPRHPFLSFFDEAGSYVNATWGRMFEQAREARIMLCPAVQTFANLESVDDELREMVLGNTWTKIFFKLGTQDSAEQAADLIGVRVGVTRSLSQTENSSESSKVLKVDPDHGLGEGAGLAYGEREQETHRVTADDLKALGPGETLVTYAGNRLYNTKVPMVTVSKAIVDETPEVKLNRFHHVHRRGVSLFEKADLYLTKGDKADLEAAGREDGSKAAPGGGAGNPRTSRGAASGKNIRKLEPNWSKDEGDGSSSPERAKEPVTQETASSYVEEEE